MSFCTKCGKEVPEGENFCPNCGTAINGATHTYIAAQQIAAPQISQAKRMGAIWGIIALVLAIAVIFSIFISPWLHFLLTVLVLILVVVCFSKHVKLFGFAIVALAVVVLNFSAYLFMYAVPGKNTSSSPAFQEEVAEDTEAQPEITNNTPQTWQEYIKKDEFGDVVKRAKADPRYLALFKGTGKTSINVNDFDATMTTAFTDGIELGSEKRGERMIIVPVYTAGSKMLSISQKGYIKAKASDGGKLEGEANVESDRFVIVDYTLYFTNHLLKGDDIQVVVGTGDGSYQFNFTMTSDNFEEIHKVVEEKEASEK